MKGPMPKHENEGWPKRYFRSKTTIEERFGISKEDPVTIDTGMLIYANGYAKQAFGLPSVIHRKVSNPPFEVYTPTRVDSLIALIETDLKDKPEGSYKVLQILRKTRGFIKEGRHSEACYCAIALGMAYRDLQYSHLEPKMQATRDSDDAPKGHYRGATLAVETAIKSLVADGKDCITCSAAWARHRKGKSKPKKNLLNPVQEEEYTKEYEAFRKSFRTHNLRILKELGR